MHRAVPVVLLAVALGVVGLLLATDLGRPGDDGRFPVAVVGPDGEMFNGTVDVEDATAYTVLLAAGQAGGFEVEATGSGESLFVVRVGEHRNAPAGEAAGWCYAVWESGWVAPSYSAGVAGLEDGQAVRWEYRAGGCGEIGGT